MKEKLKKMAQMDIRTVDKATLVDINEVHLDASLPVEERVRSYLEQVKNPYCYLSHGIAVKISFAGKSRLEDCLAKCISME